jgi:D-alanyl-D-alanine carboxypeptidase/D-alanyl-D-alanine-endopeptidase (penicillin-binding protein 4)
MSSYIRRLSITIAVLAWGTNPALGQRPTVSDQLESWYSTASGRAPGTWGVVVADQEGRVIWSVNARSPLIPASTVKLLTTGFARSEVGSEARLPTRVVGSGAVDPSDGSWIGDWSLELNGDPTLERREMRGPALSSLAQQLHDIGVRKIAGPFSLSSAGGTATASFPSVWAARHRGRTFAPPVGKVTLNENLVVLRVTPAARVGDAPTVKSTAPLGVDQLFTVEAKTVDGGRSRLAIRARGDGWIVTGTIGVRARAKGYTVVAHNPMAVVEAVWGFVLEETGIEWDQKPISNRLAFPTHQRVLAEVVSPTFDSIASMVNTNSINIGAELMLLWGGGQTQAARKLQNHVLQTTGFMEGVHLVDGSGLSDQNRVTPLVFTTYLAKFPFSESGRDFAMLLPANGSGTLKSLARGLPAKGVVRAKTGTLGNASTLVGYLGKSDGLLLIAAMYNGGYTSAARQQQWALFRTLGADGIKIPASTDVGVEYRLGK